MNLDESLIEIAPHITLTADTEYATVFVDGRQAFKLKITEKGGTLMGNVLTDELRAKIKALVVESLPEDKPTFDLLENMKASLKDLHPYSNEYRSIANEILVHYTTNEVYNQCLEEIRSIWE